MPDNSAICSQLHYSNDLQLKHYMATVDWETFLQFCDQGNTGPTIRCNLQGLQNLEMYRAQFQVELSLPNISHC